MNRKGQDIWLIGALIVMLMILLVGFPLLFVVSDGVESAARSARGGQQGILAGSVGGVMGGIVVGSASLWWTGPGAVIGGAVGGVAGAFGGGWLASTDSPPQAALEAQIGFSSPGFAAVQTSQTVLESNWNGRSVREVLEEFVYCEEVGCKDPPDSSEVEDMLEEKMENIGGNEDIGSYPYTVNVTLDGREMLEVSGGERKKDKDSQKSEEGSGDSEDSEESGSEESEDEERKVKTRVSLPLSIPTGDKAEINFFMKAGNMKVVAE